MTLEQLRMDNIDLSPVQLEELINLLGKGCRAKNKARLTSILTYSFYSLPNKWYFGRLYICKLSGRVRYCAGQDYTSEITSIRNDILNLGI